MTFQDFWPSRELTVTIGSRICQGPIEVAIHADGDDFRRMGLVNVVSAYLGKLAQHSDFVRTFPVDVVLVVCEVQA